MDFFLLNVIVTFKSTQCPVPSVQHPTPTGSAQGKVCRALGFLKPASWKGHDCLTGLFSPAQVSSRGGGGQTLWNLGRSHWATAGTRPYEVEGQTFRLKWPWRAGQLDGSECDRAVPVPLSMSGQPNLIVYNSFTMAAKQQIQLMRKQRFHQKISLGKCMKLSLFLMTTILKL